MQMRKSMLRLEEITPTHLHSHLPLLPHTMPMQAKSKESASQRTGHRRRQYKLDTTHLRTDKRATDNMGLNEMAGEVVNQTVVLSINIYGKLTVRASKPPLR